MVKTPIPVKRDSIIRKNVRMKVILTGVIVSVMATVLLGVPYFMRVYAAGTLNKPTAEATSKQVFYLTFDEQLNADTVNTVNIRVYKDGVAQTVYGVYLMPDLRVVKGILVSNMVYGYAYTPVTYWVYLNNIANADNTKTLTTNDITNTPAPSFSAFTPHGKYSPDTYTSGNGTRLCGLCHLTHSAVGGKLLSALTIQKVCFVCHGPAGSRPAGMAEPDWTVAVNVYDEFQRTGSIHKALDTAPNNILTCIDCHDPHGIRTGVGNAVWPMLLRAKNVYGTVYTTADGNWFCLACHGFGDNGRFGATFWNDTGGLHDWGMTVNGNKDIPNSPIPHYDNVNFAGVMNPASGSKVTCAKCHEKHGSNLWRLVDNSRANAKEDICYKCHNTTTYNSMNNINIKAKFDAAETGTVSKHTITDPAYGFTCSSCHGPHTVARRTFAASNSTSPSDISDPTNTKNNYNTSSGDIAGFCNKCHDVASGQTLDQTINSTNIVPYNVYLPTAAFTSTSTGWNKKTYFDASSAAKAGHYNPTRTPVQPAAMCDNCHDPHGSNYLRLSRYPEDPNSAPTSTSGMCLRCHGNVSGSPGANISRLNVYTYGFAKANRHPTLTTSGKHSDTETFPISSANRHAECVDCHDVHAARPGTTLDTVGSTWGPDGKPHTGDDTLPGVLAGVSGVSITNGGSLGSPSTNYGPKTVVQKVYELCLKCHSPYGYTTPPTSSFPYPSGSSQPDIGRQFNPNNYAFHPLFAPGRNQPPSNANPKWDGTATNGNKKSTYDDPFKAGVDSTPNPNSGLDNTFVDGWGARSIVTCTDCHSTDNSAGSANIPDGPHGSAVKWVLRKADPRVTVTLANGTVKTPNQGIYSLAAGIGRQAAENNLCINCHRADVYGWGTRSNTTVMTFQGLSRVSHLDSTNVKCIGPDGDSGAPGNKIKSGTEAMPGCFNCHGGLEPGGIHGSSMGKGGSGVSERGKRFSNGASWYPGHTLGDASGSGACWNENTVTSSINSCAQHSNKTFTPNYYYTWQ